MQDKTGSSTGVGRCAGELCRCLRRAAPVTSGRPTQVATSSSARPVGGGEPQRHRPVVDRLVIGRSCAKTWLCFARARNPFNQGHTVTMCSGVVAGGTSGAAQGIPTLRFRDRNTRYARGRFRDCAAFCIPTQVRVINGAPLTADWTLPEYRLFEWMSETNGSAQTRSGAGRPLCDKELLLGAAAELRMLAVSGTLFAVLTNVG
jgi:hypothetical protein